MLWYPAVILRKKMYKLQRNEFANKFIHSGRKTGNSELIFRDVYDNNNHFHCDLPTHLSLGRYRLPTRKHYKYLISMLLILKIFQVVLT